MSEFTNKLDNLMSKSLAKRFLDILDGHKCRMCKKRTELFDYIQYNRETNQIYAKFICKECYDNKIISERLLDEDINIKEKI